MTLAKVMVIEDDPDIRKVILMAFRFQGVTDVVTAGSGEECLALVESVMPDVILMDVMMPRMDGYETCRRLKANPTTKHVPVVFLTAKAQQYERQQGMQAGASGYLIKPFDPMTLCEQIRTILAEGAAS
jgi:two-component system cell cycle response regulator